MKQLILLLDGTWNDADIGPCDTNIVRLRDIVDRSLDFSGVQLPEAAPPKLATGRGFGGDNVEHIVLYERGVGTGLLNDSVLGGAFGDGLDDNIRRAYKFLSFYYREGDEIYIFGFSRGAYTARSLAGYIYAAGLLKRESCSAELEGRAWGYYRTAPSDRLPGVWQSLEPDVHDRAVLKIECLGVFDTVGALGVPLAAFWRANRARYGFHDVELNPIVRNNLQALAIDEHRAPFEAAPWRKTPFRNFSGRFEQVWFAGCHGDIGGSKIEEATRAQRAPHALDDIALDWMLKRLNHMCPTFPVDRLKAWKPVDSAWSVGGQHEARKGLWTLLPSSLRAIANMPPPASLLGWSRAGNYDRHASPLAEMVHVSAIERLGCEVVADDDGDIYAPSNLLAVLDAILATYGAAPGLAKPRNDIRVVGWDGHDLDPFNPVDRELGCALLSAAQTRLQAAGKAAAAK